MIYSNGESSLPMTPTQQSSIVEVQKRTADKSTPKTKQNGNAFLKDKRGLKRSLLNQLEQVNEESDIHSSSEESSPKRQRILPTGNNL